MKRLTVIIVVLVAGLILLAEFTIGSNQENVEIEINHSISTKSDSSSNLINFEKIEEKGILVCDKY